jgi:hypothetical protein
MLFYQQNLQVTECKILWLEHQYNIKIRQVLYTELMLKLDTMEKFTLEDAYSPQHSPQRMCILFNSH